MGTKLHLGCFDQPIEGWINTDITPHIWIARIPLAPAILRAARLLNKQRYLQHSERVFRKVHYLNVAKRFPFPNDSFQAVFSSHMLEHLPPMVADNCVRESFRVLCPGGVCRIVVPDLDALISATIPKNPTISFRPSSNAAADLRRIRITGRITDALFVDFCDALALQKPLSSHTTSAAALILTESTTAPVRCSSRA